MSGVAALQRSQRRSAARPFGAHRTKAQTAEDLRAVAIDVLELPGIDDEARAHAGHCLELAGELLTSPRCGWYPRRPKSWRP